MGVRGRDLAFSSVAYEIGHIWVSSFLCQGLIFVQVARQPRIPVHIYSINGLNARTFLNANRRLMPPISAALVSSAASPSACSPLPPNTLRRNRRSSRGNEAQTSPES